MQLSTEEVLIILQTRARLALRYMNRSDVGHARGRDVLHQVVGMLRRMGQSV